METNIRQDYLPRLGVPRLGKRYQNYREGYNNNGRETHRKKNKNITALYSFSESIGSQI